MKKQFALFTILFVLATGSVLSAADMQPAGKPGSFENAAPAAMADVLALDAKLKPSDKEFVIYYVRPDKNYEK